MTGRKQLVNAYNARPQVSVDDTSSGKRSTLDEVFLDWIQKVHQGIATKGDDIEEAEKEAFPEALVRKIGNELFHR
jgi:hypothetical protein